MLFCLGLYVECMLASELAQELGVDPSVITKRLTAYRAETGRDKTRLLDGQTAEHMREVHQLLQAQVATTTREAVQRALGTWKGPLSAGEAHQLFGRIEQLEASLQQINGLVVEVHGIVTARQQQRELRTELRGVSEVELESLEHGKKQSISDQVDGADPATDAAADFIRTTLGMAPS